MKLKALKSFFQFTNSNDERILKFTTKIYAEFTMLILVLTFSDVIIRGLIMGYPIKEWISSAILLVLFAVYLTVREIQLGILNYDVESETEFKSKYIELIIGFLGGLVYAFFSVSKNEGFPVDIMGWLRFIILFFCIFAGISVLILLIMRISYNKNQ